MKRTFMLCAALVIAGCDDGGKYTDHPMSNEQIVREVEFCNKHNLAAQFFSVPKYGDRTVRVECAGNKP